MSKILGVRVDNYIENQVLEIVKKSVDSNNKTQIITLNSELLLASKKDQKLSALINKAGLVIPESSGLYLADHFSSSTTKNKYVRLLLSGWKTLTGSTANLQPRLAGVDLSYSIAGLCEEFGYRLVLLGGEQKVASEAALKLKLAYPKLKVVGIYGGLVGRDDQKILNQVRKEKPDILLVAFGQPTQEYWIAENLDKITAKVAVGVGGTLDFMAGRVTRAPRLIRSLGLEWAFRLAIQPWRLKRQSKLIELIKLLLKTPS